MLHVVLLLIIIGVALWLVNTYIPMAAPIKIIVNVFVIVCVCLWLLSLFGVLDIPVPRLH